MFNVGYLLKQKIKSTLLNKLSLFNFSKKLPEKWVLGPILAEKERNKTFTWKIFPSDEVLVIDGKFKGKTGKVLRVYRKEKKILVSGINLVEVEEDNYFGEGDDVKVFKERPIWYHHVALFDKETGKKIKVKIGKDEKGKRVRRVTKTKQILKIPEREEKTYLSRHKGKVTGPKDTDSNTVLERTFNEYDFEEVAKQFLERIKEKEKVEKNLILKDK
jgi:large subunit ribosomal protein L24